MRKPCGILLAALVVISPPVWAGNIDFNNDEATWRSVNCTRPVPPASVLEANPETKGRAMNALIEERNAYAELVQNYMSCVSKEAEKDQAIINQAIVTSAQKEIDSIRAEAEKTAVPMQPLEDK